MTALEEDESLAAMSNVRPGPYDPGSATKEIERQRYRDRRDEYDVDAIQHIRSSSWLVEVGASHARRTYQTSRVASPAHRDLTTRLPAQGGTGLN